MASWKLSKWSRERSKSTLLLRKSRKIMEIKRSLKLIPRRAYKMTRSILRSSRMREVCSHYTVKGTRQILQYRKSLQFKNKSRKIWRKSELHQAVACQNSKPTSSMHPPSASLQPPHQSLRLTSLLWLTKPRQIRIARFVSSFQTTPQMTKDTLLFFAEGLTQWALTILRGHSTSI